MAKKPEADKRHCGPKKGDTYHCCQCDMTIVVTKDCRASDDEDHKPWFECCGNQLEKCD